MSGKVYCKDCGSEVEHINKTLDSLIRQIEVLKKREELLVGALKIECGNRCAHQNPCHAKYVLRELGIE